MKKKFGFLANLLLAFVTFAKPAPMPEWVTNHRAVYPDAQYIAQRGSGKSAEQARTDALAQIARYFQTSVSANLTTTLKAVQTADSVQEETTIIDEMAVMSHVRLFAAETTESYYNKKEKRWYSVAFIEREAAWRQYAPSVENAKTRFHALLGNAEGEGEPFLKCERYKAAWEDGKDFLEVLEYARILHPKNEAAYTGDRAAVSRIPALIAGEREKCVLHLSVTGDYGNIVATALTNALEKCGLRTSAGASGAAYTATAVVEPNASGADPLNVRPSVEIKIQDRGGRNVYSLQVRSEEKTVAYTLENAQKKAYPALAAECEKKLTSGFSEALGF